MKKLSLFLSVALMAAFAFNSCSVERRYHRTGLNFNWNHASVNIKKSKTNSDVATEELQEEVALIRKADNNIVAKSDVALNSNEIIVPETNSAYEAVENSSDLATNNDEMIFNQKSNNDAIQVEKVISENKSVSKISKKDVLKQTKAIKKAAGGDVPVGLLYVLCFFIPWLAVGLATDWDIKTVLFNILWTMLCGIPGIIHAFIVVARNN